MRLSVGETNLGLLTNNETLGDGNRVRKKEKVHTSPLPSSLRVRP